VENRGAKTDTSIEWGECRPLVRCPVNRSVLIIDDDEMTVELLRSLLAPDGYEVISATEGQEGYWMARTKGPGLIICDLLLPTGHGFEFLQQLKANNELNHIPVILITGIYRGAQYKAEGMRYGASAFFEKPLPQDRLIAEIHRLLPPAKKSPRRSQDALEKDIARLRAEYLSKLPAVIDWISNRCETLLNDQWDISSARLLHQAAHRMIGSGRNLRLDLVSDAARQMELFLDSLLEQGLAPTDEERGRLKHLLTDLCEAAQRQTGAAGNA